MRRQSFFLISTLFLFFTYGVYGQKRSLQIGGKLITEFEDWKTYEPGLGVQLVYRITKHSGIESGIYYKIQARGGYYYFDTAFNLYYWTVKERTLLLPVLYRYDSKTLNFTAGPVLKYSMGWKDRTKNPPAFIPPYALQNFELIATISVSRNFYLNSAWILEPEIRASAFVPAGGGGVSLNIALRKKIF